MCCFLLVPWIFLPAFAGLTFRRENRHRIVRVGRGGRYLSHRGPVCLHPTTSHRVAPLRGRSASFSLWRTCVHILPVQGHWFPEVPLAERRERPFHWESAHAGGDLLGQPTVYAAKEANIVTVRNLIWSVWQSFLVCSKSFSSFSVDSVFLLTVVVVFAYEYLLCYISNALA